MSISQLSLSEYLSAVKEVIRITFNEPVWVKAEIRNLSIKGGHYYLELAEKEQDTDKVIASCKATIWKFSAAKMVLKFERESGIELARDLNVLIKVKATFSPQYGFSVNIDDIDSSYTLGDLAQKYQDIIQRLMDEQLFDLNKSLPAPFDIQHVLVIAPENAAGLGDFQKDAAILTQHGVCEFDYHHATFQGTTAAQSIQKALTNALQQWQKQHDALPDLLVIIRGGGAVNDLAYLNDYALAASLSQLNIPIWVGIGHERDRTILDEIAHRSFDTPSKVIGGIRNHIFSRVEQAQEYFETIYSIAQQEFSSIESTLDNTLTLIQRNSQYQLKLANQQLDSLLQQQKVQVQRTLQQAQQQTEQFMRELLLQSPKHTLDRGFAVVRVAGHAVHSVQQLAGQTVQIDLQDGSAIAKVTQVLDTDLFTH